MIVRRNGVTGTGPTIRLAGGWPVRATQASRTIARAARADRTMPATYKVATASATAADRGRERQGGLHDERTDGVRQHVAAEQRRSAHADRAGGDDVVGLAQPDQAAAQQAREDRDIDDGDGHRHLHHA